SLNAFLSNLTLGFADGLTVPFALTAGLSSLGSTKTVIYAGMAEICAGSISMGIGGYLAARGDHNAEGLLLRHHSSSQNEEEDEKSLHLLSSESCTWKAQIEGMNLPADLEEKVLRHLDGKKPVIEEKDEACGGKESPVLSGLSVSLGYLLGGSLPLFPYFFLRAEDDPVKKGLVWSFVVCVVALFVFGFGKEFVLGYNDSERTLKGEEEEEEKNGIWWTGKRIRVCVWEGVQMVVLGSVAAGAAVLCVRAFEGM
ncbi:Ccc1 family, partial [Cladorrhinum sp. PSN259]